MGSFVGRGNQYIQLVKVLYCKLPTIGKQLPTTALYIHTIKEGVVVSRAYVILYYVIFIHLIILCLLLRK